VDVELLGVNEELFLPVGESYVITLFGHLFGVGNITSM